MKIAFLHYHLKPGGVTSVIRDQAEVLRKEADLLVLTGAPPQKPFPADIAVIEHLDYDPPASIDPHDTAEAVLEAIHAKWPSGCDILHVHNPILAKNRNLLQILKTLQQRGVRLLLQIHDFAEDGRPRHYFKEPYPGDCHYAVINSRDYAALLACGLEPEGLHLLPNCVDPPPSTERPQVPSNRILYPVRVIRRKNIGEAILAARFFKDRPNLTVTLPPNSPVDLARYEEWKRFVEAKRLDVAFDAGTSIPLATLFASARWLISTSISEGFGFSLLEPWLAGKFLWGRRIAGVCADFEKNGLRLDHLYDALNIPTRWIDMQSFFGKWASSIRVAAAQFSHPVSDADIKQAFNRLTAQQQIDFGLLDEAAQRRVITRVIEDTAAPAALKQINLFLTRLGRIPDEAARIAQNAAAVRSRYNRATYRQTLLSIYRKVLEKPVSHRIDKKRLVDIFFNLCQFSLLKENEVSQNASTP